MMSSDEMKATKPTKPTKPTKTMSWEEFYTKTDNANKLMDRVWYCIACTEKDIGNQKVFWEHWYWKKSSGGGGIDVASKELSEKKKKRGCNHTLTISTDGKEVDYPIWPLTFTKTSMKMYPAIDLKCVTIAPIGLSMQPLAFPTNDSRSEFRVDFCQLGKKVMYFVFVLDPNISEEDKVKNFERLKFEYGVLREWFVDVKWESNYVLGSAGEPDINPK